MKARWRIIGGKFKASLGNRARPYLKEKKMNVKTHIFSWPFHVDFFWLLLYCLNISVHACGLITWPSRVRFFFSVLISHSKTGLSSASRKGPAAGKVPFGRIFTQ